MIGRIISQYKIVEKIGEGGMGAVYKAEDLKLKRSVALKFLSRQALADVDQKARFLREAQAAAGLDHSNICTVYEVGEAPGETFIAMAYLEGQSLQHRIAAGPLDIDDAVGLGRQVAQGLQAAHRKEVVHRDIKPANVVVSSEGDAKIVDFGLAQLGGEGRVTKEGTTVGTTAYMSPEQAMGAPVDHRTDIWSLGVLIYELVLGRTPFRGHYGDAIVYSIINEEHEPLSELRNDVPPALEQIVSRALAKSAEDRYQRIDEMLADLQSLERSLASGEVGAPLPKAKPVDRKRKLVLSGVAGLLVLLAAIALFLATSHEAAIDSIAVLPLDNFSNDPDQDYFVNGMHEALIAELAQIRALAVISRTSVNRYRNTDKSLPEIARELDVDVVLEGSVLRADDRVRITVQLIGTRPERHLWAQSYDGDLQDVLSLHSEVARAVAKEIQVAVTPEENARLASTRRVDPAVYQHELLGRQLCSTQSEGDLYRGVDQFRQAIALDPSYAPAHAGLAGCYSALAMYFMPFEEGAARVKAAVTEALELDDELAEAHARNGYRKLIFERDFSGQEDFERALELDPNSVPALLSYGWFLTMSGRFDEADGMYRRAVELDPLGLATALSSGSASFMARRYDESILQLLRALQLEPDFPYAHAWLAASYVQKDMLSQAAASAERADALSSSSEDQNFLTALGWVYGSLGRRVDARRILDRINGLAPRRRVDPVRPGAIHIALGEIDRAMELLQEGAATSVVITLLPVHPFADPVRSDPRFHDALKAAGLER